MLFASGCVWVVVRTGEPLAVFVAALFDPDNGAVCNLKSAESELRTLGGCKDFPAFQENGVGGVCDGGGYARCAYQCDNGAVAAAFD